MEWFPAESGEKIFRFRLQGGFDQWESQSNMKSLSQQFKMSQNDAKGLVEIVCYRESNEETWHESLRTWQAQKM